MCWVGADDASILILYIDRGVFPVCFLREVHKGNFLFELLGTCGGCPIAGFGCPFL